MRNFFIFIFLVTLLVSCNIIPESDNLVITTSILPFKYFTESIAGSDFKVNVIVPPGASPATFEPTPSVIRSLNESDLMILDGYLGFELAWADKLAGVNPDIEILILAESQDLLYGEAHNHGDHIDYSGVDPHFWISPVSAAKIADNILEFLKMNYPERSEEFDRNYGLVKEEITKAGNYLDSILSQVEGRTFMIFHPALSYLARDYNLVQISVEAEGKEPTPYGLKEFIDHGKKENIDVIFVQREFDRKNAETIASEIGATVVEIDPLSENWPMAVRSIGDALGLSLRNNNSTESKNN